MYLRGLIPWGEGNPWPTILLVVHLGGPEGEPWGRGSERRVGCSDYVCPCVVWGEGWPGLALIRAGQSPPLREAPSPEMLHKAAVYLCWTPGALWWQPRVGETCLVFHSLAFSLEARAGRAPVRGGASGPGGPGCSGGERAGMAEQ